MRVEHSFARKDFLSSVAAVGLNTGLTMADSPAAGANGGGRTLSIQYLGTAGWIIR
jgi:hypothetical protein